MDTSEHGPQRQTVPYLQRALGKRPLDQSHRVMRELLSASRFDG